MPEQKVKWRVVSLAEAIVLYNCGVRDFQEKSALEQSLWHERTIFRDPYFNTAAAPPEWERLYKFRVKVDA